MASVFDPITLTWAGKAYVIPANRVLPAIARVEEVITMHELATLGQRGTVPMIRLAQAYGSVLRYAGCDVADDAVYAGMFDGSDVQGTVAASINALLMMMIPPAARKRMEAGLPPEKPVLAPGEKEALAEGNGVARSRSISKPRSRKAGARRRSSGR